MKTWLSPFIRIRACFGLLAVLLADTAHAQYNYTTNNGTITITGYSGPGGAVAIPGTINGLPVTEIADFSFRGNNNLTSVAIPDGVHSIGNYAFDSCFSLISVTLPNSLTSIGDFAFAFLSSGLGGRTSVTIPNSVTNIGMAAFAGNPMQEITVAPDNPSYISVDGVLFDKPRGTLIQYPARTASNVEPSYEIPNTVTNIGGYAFYYCFLNNVTMGTNVTSIGVDAFAFSSLTNVTLSMNLTRIAESLFYSCPYLTSISIPANVTSIGANAFVGAALNSVVIPNSVTNIGDAAFSGSLLTNITIGTNVTRIGNNAFELCTHLAVITIPASVTSIGVGAFVPGNLKLYFQGNEPSADSRGIFGSAGVYNLTPVYYLAGTTGWGATLGGKPTVALSPQQISSAGLENNEFGFTFTGTNTQVIVVEATSNISNQDWQPIQTNTLTGNFFFFGDPAWSNYPARFYRVRSP
jgi:hypothetical protein